MKARLSDISSWLLAAALVASGSLTSDMSAQNRRTYNSRTTTTQQHRPGNGNNNGHNRPGNGNNNGHNRPGNGNNNGHNRPGNGNNNGHNRPGNGNNNGHNRPGNHGYRPGGSVPRPGSGSTYRHHRPYKKPNPAYGRPPGHFGHWRPLPPPPPKPRHYRPVTYVVPSISTVLGLTFGTLIDYGIRSLINSGYNVAGYQDNAIFISDVGMLGCTWPQATVYYGSSGMNGALFQYRAPSFAASPYNKVYRQLCESYGMPVETTSNGNSRSATWWGGNNTGYITLSTDYGYDDGTPAYDTSLIYGYGQ